MPQSLHPLHRLPHCICQARLCYRRDADVLVAERKEAFPPSCSHIHCRACSVAPQAGALGKETAIMNMAHCFVNIKRALECPESATKGSSHNSLARTDHLARPAAKVPARALGLVPRRQRWKPQRNSTNGSQQSHPWETSGEAWRGTSGWLYA